MRRRCPRPLARRTRPWLAALVLAMVVSPGCSGVSSTAGSSAAPTASPSAVAAVSSVAASSSGVSRTEGDPKREAIEKSNEGDKALAANIDAAIADYDAATKLDPTNDKIWNKLAVSNAKKENWAEAARAYRGAVKADADAHHGKPTVAQYQRGLGVALEKLASGSGGPTSLDDALGALQQCLDIDANDAECALERGNVYLAKGDEQNAEASYASANAMAPSNLKVYAALAGVKAKLGHDDDAIALLRKAQTVGPANPNTEEQRYMAEERLALGELLLKHHDAKAAVHELEGARDLDPAGRVGMLVFDRLADGYAALNPPDKQKALDNLRSFYKRVCKGPKAAQFKEQCGTAEARATALGGQL